MLLMAKMLDFGTEKGVKNEHSFSYVSFFTTHFRVKRCICRPKGIVEIASTLLHQGKRTIPGIEYTNSTVDAIYHAEGRAVKDGSTWDHEYVITDHLGNTRVRFHDDNGNGTINSSELLSTHDYYPFGMEWNAGSYQYTYNGKERNDELGLDLFDFGARMYDPVIGNWLHVDPMSGSMVNWTPYNYAFRNPVLYTDPSGLYSEIGCPDCPVYVHPGVTVTAANSETNYDQSVERYGFNGTYAQWQVTYGYEDWSYQSASDYYNQYLSAQFDDYVYQQDSTERSRIATEKMGYWFGTVFPEVGTFAMGGVYPNLPLNKGFNFTSPVSANGSSNWIAINTTKIPKNALNLGLPQKVNATGVLFLSHAGCWRKRA